MLLITDNTNVDNKSGILAILDVSYGWEGSKINPILWDLVGTGFWRQKPLVCTP